MFWKTAERFALLVFFVLTASIVPAAPRVVLRQAAGDKTLAPRFYQVTEAVHPVATAWFPTEKDSLELLPARTSNEPATYRDRLGRPFAPPQPVVVYDYAEVPSGIRNLLSRVVHTVVDSELAGKPYDKKRVKKREEYVKLPAPTLRHPKRTKRHRVLATEEEYHIQAELEGPAEIAVSHMPYLKQHDLPNRGLLILVLDARFPVRGRVRYKVPSVLNVSTGYHAVVVLRVVAEIRVRRGAKAIEFDAPEVLRIDLRLEKLALSNDVLDAARGPIRDFLNEEARRKHDRIRQQANKAIAKAVNDKTFRSPLLRYLLPL